MSKNRTDSLRLVLSMAERAENDAADRLRLQREQLHTHVNQLQQIVQYNREYGDQIGRLGSMNIQQMIGQRNFMSQLGSMVESQTDTVDALRQQTQKAEQQWYSHHLRRKSLIELIERLELEQNRVEQARLQKELDELSRGFFAKGALH